MAKNIIPAESLESRIRTVRGLRVILDADIAALYGVQTKALTQAVKRNPGRFPADFMFQLTLQEAREVRSQSVTLNAESRATRGTNVKYLPRAFTEQGVAMLSSVLRSERAIQVNVEIMRVFVRLREAAAAHQDLARRLNELERRSDTRHREVFQAIRLLMTEQVKIKAKLAQKQPSSDSTRRRIGFRRDEGK